MVKEIEKIAKENSSDTDIALRYEAEFLAQKLYGNNIKKRTAVVARIMNICKAAEKKDVIVIHSPGGWGCSEMEHLIDWERSVVMGIQDALKEMGCDAALVQYFRSGNSTWEHLAGLPEQVRYFFTGEIPQAETAAAELTFVAEHFRGLKMVLLGVSQGAAFNNAVMKFISKEHNIHSIELGMFFSQLPRRIITERTLAIDSNGLMPDPVVHRNLRAGMKAYFLAPFSWIKYKVAGEPVKFTYCINVPGHDYNWKYPDVQRKITNYLKNNL